MPLRILVTGGAGFIGSHLVERLIAEGHQVDVVDDLSSGSLAYLSEARAGSQRRLTFHQLDACSTALHELMSRSRPQIVYHLAAGTPAAQDAAGLAEEVIVGSLRIMEGARAADAQKVVFAASAALYGEVPPSDLPVKESSATRPLHPRGVAEKAVVDYLQAYREVHSLEFSVLALGNVYGPRQPDRGVVGTFARRLLAGEPCPVVGTGSQTRDFVYVDDVVDAFARAAERGGGLVLNVGTGRETSISDLHRAMARQAAVESLAESLPPGLHDLGRLALDPGRAAIHLGWKPWTALEDGLAATFDWYAQE